LPDYFLETVSAACHLDEYVARVKSTLGQEAPIAAVAAALRNARYALVGSLPPYARVFEVKSHGRSELGDSLAEPLTQEGSFFSALSCDFGIGRNRPAAPAE
jgi:hypothetical protein